MRPRIWHVLGAILAAMAPKNIADPSHKIHKNMVGELIA
jgi:hypothetical protein